MSNILKGLTIIEDSFLNEALPSNINDDDWYEIDLANNKIVKSSGPQAYNAPFGTKEIKLPNNNIVVRGMTLKMSNKFDNITLSEDLRKWFKEKWVRFGPDGKIRGSCARGDDSEGKPKCLPQAKAHALGKKGRKYAASKKRREDPNPERSGPAKNVATKKKSNESVSEAFGPLPRDNQQIRLGRHTVDIERVGLDKNYISFAWHDSQGQEHYEEVPVGDLGSYDDLIKKIKQEISYQERQYTDQGVAEQELDEACWKGYHKEGNKKMFGKTYPNCVKNTNEEQELDEDGYQDDSKEREENLRYSRSRNPVADRIRKKLNPNQKEHEHNSKTCPHCGGELVSEEMINEKQDACYYKVKSRYKVWPSAYASGALVQCRKKGAKNWGNKSEGVAEGTVDETTEQFYNLVEWKKAARKLKMFIRVGYMAGTKGVKIYEAETEDQSSGGRFFAGPGWNYGHITVTKQGVAEDQLDEKWSQKYKDSINCSNPKGFSQKAHCAGKNKNESAILTGLKLHESK